MKHLFSAIASIALFASLAAPAHAGGSEWSIEERYYLSRPKLQSCGEAYVRKNRSFPSTCRPIGYDYLLNENTAR